MAYTPNLLLQIPAAGDPAQFNAWGTMENTGRSLVDTAIAGTQPLSIAGSGTTILTSLSGIADQSRAAHYNFTGVLTGASVVLWPQNCGRMFSVANNTTGAFSLTLGANNGSGTAGGATVVIPQGTTALCGSDGTNVFLRDDLFQAISGNAPAFNVNMNLVQPNGLIFKTGIVGGGGGLITFATAFPNNLLGVWAAALESPGGAGGATIFANAYPVSRSQMQATTNNVAFAVQWFAIGN